MTGRRANQQPKGSSLKTKVNKDQKQQGRKRQVSKDEAQAIMGCECPDKSCVSLFVIWNSSGFLNGRVTL